MPKEIHLIKNAAGMLAPATSDDADILSTWKLGQAVKVSAVRVSPRSLKHHRLYFGGLLGLAFDYWEPIGGLVLESEKSAIEHFIRWIGIDEGSRETLTEASEIFLKELAAKRGGKIEIPSKNKDQLHEWVKIEAGWFDYVQTPRGLRKEARSINFNSMGQDEFEQFYRDAFSVVWRFVLSQHFDDEAGAQHAIDNLVDMG